MPHLSPMNWLLAILSIWLMTMSLMSILWWNTSTKWPSLTSNSSSSKILTWKWT